MQLASNAWLYMCQTATRHCTKFSCINVTVLAWPIELATTSKPMLLGNITLLGNNLECDTGRDSGQTNVEYI